jgi:hypothetical protein
LIAKRRFYTKRWYDFQGDLAWSRFGSAKKLDGVLAEAIDMSGMALGSATEVYCQ